VKVSRSISGRRFDAAACARPASSAALRRPCPAGSGGSGRDDRRFAHGVFALAEHAIRNQKGDRIAADERGDGVDRRPAGRAHHRPHDGLNEDSGEFEQAIADQEAERERADRHDEADRQHQPVEQEGQHVGREQRGRSEGCQVHGGEDGAEYAQEREDDLGGVRAPPAFEKRRRRAIEDERADEDDRRRPRVSGEGGRRVVERDG
jgi:hypothetical protein